MSEQESLHGLSCPNCGGIVPIPEGQLIVHCPYCELNSIVRGERGQLRYQVASRLDRQAAEGVLQRFLKGSWAIARDARQRAELGEVFLAYLPFWSVWGRVMGWAFGKRRVGSGKSSHYAPREVKLVEEMNWNAAACDVGEFGVEAVALTNQELQPFNPDSLHALGLVFEPVNSVQEAKASAQADFELRVRSRSNLDRTSQLFVRSLKNRVGLVYYPLWVVRYRYRGRAFQVVADGFSGQVLYGKAPGNTLYRSAILVLGMAVGAFTAIDLSSLIIFLSSSSSNQNDNPLAFAGIVALFGLGLMFMAYRTFRYGEQYEVGRAKKINPQDLLSMRSFTEKDVAGKVQDLETWLNRLN